MARPKGVEPLTARFVAEYSIQLSYGRVMKCAFFEKKLGILMKIRFKSINFDPKFISKWRWTRDSNPR